MYRKKTVNKLKVSEIIDNKVSLSPSNYDVVSINNPRLINVEELLDDDIPFVRGVEPGSDTYIKNSDYKLVRNGDVSSIRSSVKTEESISLIPNAVKDLVALSDGDLLLSTDANIGDAAVFLRDFQSNDVNYYHSSGLVKLNLKDDSIKYYLLASFKDYYFRCQLESMTPKGSTIRHAGSRFLECKILDPSKLIKNDLDLIGSWAKQIAQAERMAKQKTFEIDSIFDDIIDYKNVHYKSGKSITNISKVIENQRLDAGMYSETVNKFFEAVKNHGGKSLTELGFETRRGPNLAKRDLGRSLQSETYLSGFYSLIYPSDIAEFGYLDNVTYLGTRSNVWFLKKNDILFSAEGNVGKTFIVCENNLKFTTNFHGIIVTPIENADVSLADSVFVGLFLQYMKRKGIFDRISVGGQGGSFATQYWDLLMFPDISKEDKKKLLKLYYNEDSDIESFDSKMGIYQLSCLRTKLSEKLNKKFLELENQF